MRPGGAATIRVPRVRQCERHQRRIIFSARTCVARLALGQPTALEKAWQWSRTFTSHLGSFRRDVSSGMRLESARARHTPCSARVSSELPILIFIRLVDFLQDFVLPLQDEPPLAALCGTYTLPCELGPKQEGARRNVLAGRRGGALAVPPGFHMARLAHINCVATAIFPVS